MAGEHVLQARPDRLTTLSEEYPDYAWLQDDTADVVERYEQLKSIAIECEEAGATLPSRIMAELANLQQKAIRVRAARSNIAAMAVRDALDADEE